jgi:predicted glycogen debranching enzyme
MCIRDSFQIRVDPDDGLLYAGQADVQLTWMDVKIGDWVVTPRIGKAVEINALWYNALRTMADFARDLEKDAPSYASLAYQVKQNFQKFWNNDLGCCYDVIDGPQGDDASIRPNQLFAVSLSPDLLNPEQQEAVVNCCQKHLLTTYGLRSLSPDGENYHGWFRGDMVARDSAYHQGTVWGWLIGPFVSAHYRVYRDRQQALSFLEGFKDNLNVFGLGTINEIFEGDPPHAPRGCIAQAWSVAEVLRVWYQLQG